MWGKKQVQTQPIRNYKYQFIYRNWLFINETTVMDLNYALNSGQPLSEKNLFWHYDIIPFEILEKSVIDYVAKQCFVSFMDCL